MGLPPPRARAVRRGGRRRVHRAGRSAAEEPHRPDLRGTAATFAPGLRSPLPHLRRDWARPSHICAGTAGRGGTVAARVSLVGTLIRLARFGLS